MVPIIYKEEWDNFGSKFMGLTLSSIVSMGVFPLHFPSHWLQVCLLQGNTVNDGVLPYVC